MLRQGVVLSEHDSSHVLYILRYLYILQLFLPLSPCVRLVMLLQHILYKGITAQKTNNFKTSGPSGISNAILSPQRLNNELSAELYVLEFYRSLFKVSHM